VWHAHAAVSAPGEHCRHAGPLGAGVCGSDPCADFCSMAWNFCGTNSYPSESACLDACHPDAGVDDAGYPGFKYDTNASDLQDMGDTLNCRLYHLENFINTGDGVHCSHVAQDGGDMCIGAPSGSQ
jgi:hypothetical protein